MFIFIEIEIKRGLWAFIETRNHFYEFWFLGRHGILYRSSYSHNCNGPYRSFTTFWGFLAYLSTLHNTNAVNQDIVLWKKVFSINPMFIFTQGFVFCQAQLKPQLNVWIFGQTKCGQNEKIKVVAN